MTIHFASFFIEHLPYIKSANGMPAWAFGTGINNARYFQHLGMIFCPIRKALRELFGKGQLKRRKILLLVINTMRCCSTFGTDKQSGVSAHWFCRAHIHAEFAILIQFASSVRDVTAVLACASH